MNRYMDIIEVFKSWFSLKPILYQKQTNIFFKQGEVWWCSIGMNIGEEEFGKGLKFTRPILIFKKFTKNSFLALPLTSQEKQGSWYVQVTHSNVKNWIMLNQARVIDKRRLTKRIATLDDSNFNKVKSRFIDFYSF